MYVWNALFAVSSVVQACWLFTKESNRTANERKKNKAWQAKGNVVSPFTADTVKALHFAILVLPTIFNFWHSGTLALRTERQSARMSEIKNGGLVDQYGAGPFEQQQFGTSGVKGVKLIDEKIHNGLFTAEEDVRRH